jgi:uncharacterized NAD-dependent epimerase/dehydratase family protein
VKRSWLILTDGYLTERDAKTAHGILRYAPEDVAAVLDREHAGRLVPDVIPELTGEVPIVATLEEGLGYSPTSLLLGVATPGGWIPDHWRALIVDAIRSGLEIVSGLHRFLSEDEELVALAREHGARLWDVRSPPAGIPLYSGRTLEIPQKIVHTVGSDCAVGKKTAALELTSAARRAGRAAQFLATGQTGVLIAGKGLAIDRVIADFAAGAAEQLVVDADPDTEVLVVEGQGSLWHPAYSGVTLSLLHGCNPHALVLCHQLGREKIEDPPYLPLPSLSEMVKTYESLASVVRPAKVACIVLNTHGWEQDAARDEIRRIEDQTGLPAGDVLLPGIADRLWSAVDRVLNGAIGSRDRSISS